MSSSSFELHVYHDREGRVKVSATLPNGKRTRGYALRFAARAALHTVCVAVLGFELGSKLMPYE